MMSWYSGQAVLFLLLSYLVEQKSDPEGLDGNIEVSQWVNIMLSDAPV